MTAFNAIQNATIQAIAGFQAGLVVDATNAHRSYRPCEVRPGSKHPNAGISSKSLLDGSAGLKQGRLQTDAAETDTGTGSGTMPTGRMWRMENRHLPATAWAMLVINRSMCG